MRPASTILSAAKEALAVVAHPDEASIGAADLLLAFDRGGIIGHLDHVQATAVALGAATSRGLSMLGWAVPAELADQLNAELGTCCKGWGEEEIDVVVEVAGPRTRSVHSDEAKVHFITKP